MRQIDIQTHEERPSDTLKIKSSHRNVPVQSWLWAISSVVKASKNIVREAIERRFFNRLDVQELLRVIDWLEIEWNSILIIAWTWCFHSHSWVWVVDMMEPAILNTPIDSVLLKNLIFEGILEFKSHWKNGTQLFNKWPAFSYFSNLPSGAIAKYEIEEFFQRTRK